MKNEKFSVSKSFFSILFWTIVICLILCYASVIVNPAVFVYLAPFGLLYPVFIAVVLVVLFFILVQRQWKRMLFLLLLIVVGFPLHQRYFNFGKAKTIKKGTHIKVMSYNVRLFNLYSWNKTKNYKVRDSIFQFLQKVNPDIICFQEFYYADSVKFETKDTLLQLLKAKNFHGQFTKTAHKITQHYGVATLSAYPIINQGEIELNSVVSNFCIYSDIKKGDKIFRIYNAHIGSIQFREADYAFFEVLKEGEKPKKESNIIGKILLAYKTRAKEINRIIAHARKSPYPTIVCGDFNDTPISYCYQQLTATFTDAFLESGTGVGTTYEGKIPSNRIDYIFHSNDFTSSNFHIQQKVLSDHRAIWTNLYLH